LHNRSLYCISEVMFLKPERVVLVRHGRPISGRPEDDSAIVKDSASLNLLDFAAEDIQTSLVANKISRLLFLSSPALRAVKTSEYLIKSLLELGRATDAMIQTDLLSLDSKLGLGVTGSESMRVRSQALQEFSDYVDELVVGPDTGVVAVTHEEVVRAIGTLAGVDSMDIHYDTFGGVTIVK
jgi:hypothetical protein